MIDGITRDILEQRDNIENQRNREFNSNREALIKKQEKEIERLNNIIDELEKWLNEYYESNRKWYNYELTTHDRELYEREYRNTEFMIVKFIKQLNELKGDNK